MARQGVPVLIDRPADKTFSAAERKQKPVWNSAERFIPLPYAGETFAEIGVDRDFAAFEKNGAYTEGFAYRHRRTPESDIYFIANQTDKTRDITVSLRVRGRNPQIWLPVSGEIRTRTEWKEADGLTIMPLRLAPCESLFVVLQQGEDATSVKGGNWIETPPPCCEIKTPWTVSFDADTQSGCIATTLPALTDWSTHTDPRIRYYSGTAVYANKFRMEGRLDRRNRYFIESYEVCNMAEIKINGKLCGTMWTPPYRVEITDAIRPGDNTVEIAVVNTWANRIRGNHLNSCPSTETWTIVPYNPNETSRQKSGLVGEVRVCAVIGDN